MITRLLFAKEVARKLGIRTNDLTVIAKHLNIGVRVGQSRYFLPSEVMWLVETITSANERRNRKYGNTETPKT